MLGQGFLRERNPALGGAADEVVGLGLEDGLERLLRYRLRPALSLKRLEYRAQEGRVRYRPDKGRPGEPDILDWPAEEFVERFARLVPPPRHHLIRYSGALGRRSKLRPMVTRAAQDRAPYEALAGSGWFQVAGVVSGTVEFVRRAGQAANAAARSWTAMLRRVFEVEPLVCDTRAQRGESFRRHAATRCGP